MQIKYLGPSPFVNVGEFGPHYKGKVKGYPKEVGEELLATAKRQEFEAVSGEPDSDKAKEKAEAEAKAKADAEKKAKAEAKAKADAKKKA